MQEMYDKYKNVAEFRIVYIREAHAADSKRPVQYAKDKNIFNHKNYGERCTTADIMMKEKKITIPCIIDGMDNMVNKAYKGHPTRAFLVKKDGVLAVAGKRGPWGYKPALKEATAWLAHYKKTGEELDSVKINESGS